MESKLAETTSDKQSQDQKVTFVLPFDGSTEPQPGQDQTKQAAEKAGKKPQQLMYNSMKRKTYSKYDLVKVKVSLEDHFYVFSRFLISRILTLIKVKERDSIRMTLEVKKMLVESNQLEISQKELEKKLFEVLLQFGYGDNYVNRYQMMTYFYQKRVPFIIMIAGTECIGKSTLVTQLAERINISNIVQTTIVQKVMNGLFQLNKSTHLGDDNHQSEQEIIDDYRRMCRQVRKGCNYDIQKCFLDGKPLIIEGSHLDPDCYIASILDDLTNETKLKIITPDPYDEEESAAENESIKKMRKTMQNIDQKGAMIIPFLLTITPQSHALCLESKIQQEFSQKAEKDLPQDIKQYVEKRLRKYQTIQDHLKVECKKHNFNQLDININQFEETIATIHDIILKEIEDAYSLGKF